MNKLLIVCVLLFMSFYPSNLPWSPSYQEKIKEKLDNYYPLIQYYPSFIYPNEKVNELFAKKKTIYIFAYGSLLNPESAQRTISEEAVETSQPALAFGLKRIYNYYAGQKTHWITKAPKEEAMLNVEVTRKRDDLVNGALIKVDITQLKKLIEREKGYDLVPVLTMRWNDAILENTQFHFIIAYTFTASSEPRLGKAYTQKGIYPIYGYNQAVEKGAERFGDKFLNYLRTTTYLSDGITNLYEWELNQLPLTQSN
ncbi:hypothetical protein BN1013_01065 [Candidatus Rubidus massiliensis]|nr:hypothetical protein BN1013_01065 [Candidatus Rubidus massiliensis]